MLCVAKESQEVHLSDRQMIRYVAGSFASLTLAQIQGRCQRMFSFCSTKESLECHTSDRLRQRTHGGFIIFLRWLDETFLQNHVETGMV